MTSIYRIYTERRTNLAEIASRYFDSFTIFDGQGVYKKTFEYSAVIAVIGADWQGVKRLAQDIKQENNQESVIITEQPVTVHLI